MIEFSIVCNEEGSWILRKKGQQYEMHMAKWTDVDFPLDLKLTVTFRKHHPKEIQISSKDKPCDSTCSGVELSLLVDPSSSRLGIFLRERNATITKKSREEGFWRYAVRKDFWDGRRSIFHKGQNKYNQRRPYLPVLSGKNEAFSGFWDSL